MGFDLGLFFLVFGLIFVAEIPDKTAIASLILATRHNPFIVFIGAAAALTIQSVIAIIGGTVIGFLPASVVHIGSAILFFVFAFFMWRRDEEDEEKKEEEAVAKKEPYYRGIWLSFSVVFIAEWGDLTQLTTATLAARYHAPLTVFLAATLALWAVAALAIGLGNRAGKLFNPELTKKVAAVIFVILGFILLYTAYTDLFS